MIYLDILPFSIDVQNEWMASHVKVQSSMISFAFAASVEAGKADGKSGFVILCRGQGHSCHGGKFSVLSSQSISYNLHDRLTALRSADECLRDFLFSKLDSCWRNFITY